MTDYHEDTNGLKASDQANSNQSHKENESLLLPGSILFSGIIISLAILVAGSPSGTGGSQALVGSGSGQPAAETSRLELAFDEADYDSEALVSCAADGVYDDQVQSDIDNAVATGGRGTPWTVVIDTQTGNRYPLGGAYPTQQVTALLDNNFADLPAEALEGVDLSVLRPVDETDYYRGPADARYVFVEYSDFDCPFCSRFHETMTDLLSSRTDVAWVYRHFPLESLHPDARYVANVSECIGQNGDDPDRFWEFADNYFSQQ